MRHYVKVLSVLSATTLMGCSQVPQSPKVQAVERITSPVSEVENVFILGRTAHALGQVDLAERRYAKVLILQPEHMGALNGMAVIYAQTQRPEYAYVLFQRALAIDPNAAYVHNNWGYALMLAGRLSEAQDQLNQAQALNPGSQLTRKNQALLATAKAVENSGKNGSESGRALQLAASKPVTHEGPQLVAVQANVYELREAVVPTSPINALFNGVKIEVSNGVGIPNLARKTAKRLAPMGVVTARLTNQPGYKQVTTEIFYTPGQRDAAQALSAKLPIAAQMMEARDLDARVQLRLVLGHDVDAKALAEWLDAPQDLVVALNPMEGWHR